jgi:hypothetical protein
LSVSLQPLLIQNVRTRRDVPVMRTVITHLGREFRVQARFAGDGSSYLRRQ